MSSFRSSKHLPATPAAATPTPAPKPYDLFYVSDEERARRRKELADSMRSLCEELAVEPQPEPEPKAEQDTPFNAARFERENEILMYNMKAKLAEQRAREERYSWSQ